MSRNSRGRDQGENRKVFPLFFGVGAGIVVKRVLVFHRNTTVKFFESYCVLRRLKL